MVQRNKDILLAAKTDEKVHYICDKLIRDHFHNFNLGGGQWESSLLQALWRMVINGLLSEIQKKKWVK